MDDILIPDKLSLDGIEPYMLQVSNLNKPLLTIHADGHITVAEHLKPTETAAEVMKIMQDMWLSNQQVVKIKELQERIKRLEEAGDVMLNAWLMPEDSMEYCDWVALSADAKAMWFKAKEAKP